MKRGSLGEQELMVLRFVTDKAPISVRAVADAFAESHGLARTTILTVLERLRTKGHLSREKAGGAYQYLPTQDRGDLLKGVIGEFVRSRLGGSLSPFVAYLADSDEIPQHELEELRALVDRMDEKEKGK